MSAPMVIDAVFFDAVGTLLDPWPPVRRAYMQAGRRHGHEATEEEIGRRFHLAFAHEESRDRVQGYRTCEAREAERWRAIVAATLPGVGDLDACYRELHDHFAHSDSWQLTPGAGELVSLLSGLGIRVGIASNFDSRLHEIIRGKPELAGINHVVVSSETGWRKPAEPFFHHLACLAKVPKSRILVVGDNPENDVAGPTRMGMQAILVSPDNPGKGGQDLWQLARMFSRGLIVPGPESRAQPAP